MPPDRAGAHDATGAPPRLRIAPDGQDLRAPGGARSPRHAGTARRAGRSVDGLDARRRHQPRAAVHGTCARPCVARRAGRLPATAHGEGRRRPGVGQRAAHAQRRRRPPRRGPRGTAVQLRRRARRARASCRLSPDPCRCRPGRVPGDPSLRWRTSRSASARDHPAPQARDVRARRLRRPADPSDDRPAAAALQAARATRVRTDRSRAPRHVDRGADEDRRRPRGRDGRRDHRARRTANARCRAARAGDVRCRTRRWTRHDSDDRGGASTDRAR